MSVELPDIYYRKALLRAKRGDLSGAAASAHQALCLQSGHSKARRLLGLCLYELGYPTTAVRIWDDPAKAVEHTGLRTALAQVKELAGKRQWRKAEKTVRALPHQSVRLLLVRGCLFATAKKYGAAAKLFAAALEKDAGNTAAQAYLTESIKRQRRFWP